MNVVRFKKPLIIISILTFLIFPNEVIGSVVSILDMAITAGVWYLEFLMLRGIVRFLKRGFKLT